MLSWLLVFAMVALETSSGHDGGNWGYHRDMNFSSPEQWRNLRGSFCGGERQSPIDIVTKDSVYWSHLAPVTIPRGISTAQVVLATGATSMSLTFSDAWNMTLGGEGCLRPIAIHWHWGTKNHQGSEHTINGVKYAMEAHVVTYNCALYKTPEASMHAANGLYVFSVLYNIGARNTAIESLEKHIALVRNQRRVLLQEISPRVFLPRDLSSYYRYEGSLTTPPCTENVVWTVFSEIQTLSPEQILLFRSLRNGPPEVGPMGDNFRPVQILDDSIRLVRPRVFVSVKSASMLMYHLRAMTLTVLCTISLLV